MAAVFNKPVVGQKGTLDVDRPAENASKVDCNYGTPEKTSIEHKEELQFLVSFSGSKAKLPPTPEKVCGHITAMIGAMGKKLVRELPYKYQKALKDTEQILQDAGRSPEDVDATRFAVAQFLTQKLSQSEC